MQTESIIVIVAMSIFTFYVIHEAIKALKKRSTLGLIPFILLAIGVLFLILVLYKGQELMTADWVQILLMGGLVTITAVYAWSTDKIAKETREQRYSESLPILVPSVTRGITQGLELGEIAYESLQSGIGLKVAWQNVGKGVAINVRFSLHGTPLSSGKVPLFQLHESQALGSGGQKETDPSKWDEKRLDKPKLYKPRLEAEYQDIYERKVTTVQKFRIDEQNKRAFLGELYFKVNGRRLGG